MGDTAEAMPKTGNSRESLSWSDMPGSVYIKCAIIAICILFLFHHQLQKIIHAWLNDPSWSHGFLIPLFSLYLLHQRKQDLVTLRPRPSYLGLAGLVFCLIVYFLNIAYFRFGYGEPLLMLASLGCVVLFLGGWKLLWHTWLPVAYLIFAVPLPARFYRQLTIPMRKLAAQAATSILGLVPDLEATAKGVVIDVVYKGVALEPALDVAEACSGMRLLMAFVALGVAMAYLHYRPMWQRLILLVSTIPIAILCNIVRVTVTGCIYIFWDPQYAQGIYHDALGMAMLPLAFLFYGGLAWLMTNIFIEEEEAPQPDIIVRQKDQTGSDESNF